MSTMASGDERDEMKEPEWMVKKREYEERMARAKNAKLRTLCTICSAKAKLPCPCGTAQYCTVACQRIDWRDRGHRKACKKIRDERAAEAARAEAPTPPQEEVFYGPAPRSHADEVRARIAAEHEAARARREAEPEREPQSARYGSRCPICMEDWNVNEPKVILPCCCRSICRSCIHAKLKRDLHGPCALCRAPQPEDEKAELAMYRRHADNDVPEAVTQLGDMYRRGDSFSGVVKSTKKAAKLYKRAVELGNVDAMLKLGYLYDNGDGVKLDKKKAEQLYRVAADKGDACAQFGLFQLLKADQRLEEATHYLRLSAEQGYTMAETGLGMQIFWQHGPDAVDEARRWLDRAAAKGDEDASRSSHLISEITARAPG